MVPVFRNVEERPAAKIYCPVSLPPVLSKVFEKFVNNKLAHHLGLLDQLQILLQLYLIRMSGLLIGLGLLQL